MKVTLPIWVVVIVAIIMVVLVLIVWSVKRRKRPHIKLEEGDDASDLFLSIAGLTQSTLLEGNAIRLLENGAFFDELFADIERAKESIHIESFLSKEGEVTRRLTELLIQKRREGVHVRLLLDGSGGKEFGKDEIKRLGESKCTVVHYHPMTWRNLGLINHRTHRKIGVIDGRIGYVGGHCFVDTWLGNAEDKKHFRDITARVEGPVVAQLQSAFSDNWVEECGEVFGGEVYFPELQACGDTQAHVVFVSPSGAPSTMKILYYMAIRAAKKSITIQNPYFLPDPDAREAIAEAVKRGVKVRVMIPSETASDSPLVQHASHHHFGTLLKRGVEMYEYQRTLLHQKVITIDGCWSAVGSTNFDDRSLEINDEVAIVVFGEEMASQLEAIFERDKEHADKRELEQWRRRPALHKLRDFSSFLFNEQL